MNNINTKNIWEEKLNIGYVIEEIGPGQKITLVFNERGEYMVISKYDNYYPSDQGEIFSWKYKVDIFIKRDETEGDWPKYAAENHLWDIEQQIFPKAEFRIAKS